MRMITFTLAFFFIFKGFLAHGTKTSDDYRKLIALIRQTQITNLYPYTPNNEVSPTVYL